MGGWLLNLFAFPSGVSLLLRFGVGGWMLRFVCFSFGCVVKFVCFSIGCVVASMVWGVGGWMLNLFVFPSGVSLLIRFGGGWVDVKIYLCFVRTSLLLRFGGVWVDVKFVCFSSKCALASKVRAVGGWMLNLFAFPSGVLLLLTPLTIPSGEFRNCWRNVPLTIHSVGDV